MLLENVRERYWWTSFKISHPIPQLKHRSMLSWTHAPEQCATITDTNHLYSLFLDYCNFLDLTLKLTYMFSIIPRYISIPSFELPTHHLSPPFQWSKSAKDTHHGSVVHHDSSNGPCAYCHALVGGGPLWWIQAQETNHLFRDLIKHVVFSGITKETYECVGFREVGWIIWIRILYINS